MRPSVLLLAILFLGACTSSPPDAPEQPERRADTLARYGDGAPKVVAISQGDSVLERRTYRPTGRLFRVEGGDSVRTYFDLHDPDSAEVLRDYLRGRWRNLSADSSRSQASVYYVFGPDRLTFENAARDALESLSVEYQNERTVTTEYGMSVRPEIAAFDTVRVTGYTLVRQPPADSAR